MSATKNPVALAGADRARNTDLAGWQIASEHNPPHINIQLLRAARAVLAVYFGETAR
jgi:hypothetical protein